MSQQGPELEVAVIGAGFGGLGMAIRLLQQGVTRFQVFEKAGEVGGTWRDNRYPGCACDIPSILYSFSFEQWPHWSRYYPSQPEILAYLKHCADTYGLRPHIRFETPLASARFDEAGDFWRLVTPKGEVTARSVVAATGPLSKAAWPDIPGLARFAGVRMHSAEWNDAVSLEGKRVAVIGTGASAIQFVPQIAPQTASLTVFQRTAPWILPKRDRPLSGLEHTLFAAAPILQDLVRKGMFWGHEARAMGFVLDPKLMRRAEQMARRHMEAQVWDGQMRQRLTPDYTLGCKRVLISNDYYPALMLPHVELVTEAIAGVEEAGVRLQSGRLIAADVLICGTGFQTVEPLHADFFGLGGRSLAQDWREQGAEAYLGVMAAGYPNLFFLLGPNSGLGHNSVVLMAEGQIGWALQALAWMRREGRTRLAIRPELQAQFNTEIQDRIAKTVWQSGCKSWYLREDGKNVTLWPGFVFQYLNRVRRLDPGVFAAPEPARPAAVRASA